MRVAFHFDSNQFGGYYGPPITQLLFRELIQCIPQQERDLFVRRGDLLLWEFARDAHGLGRIAERVLQNVTPIWSSMTKDALAAAFVGRNVWLLVVEGLALPQAITVEKHLRQTDGYLGAIEVDLGNPVHWVIYDQKLVAAYHVFSNELRLLAPNEKADPDARDDGRIRDWSQTGLFSQVAWEDLRPGDGF